MDAFHLHGTKRLSEVSEIFVTNENVKVVSLLDLMNDEILPSDLERYTFALVFKIVYIQSGTKITDKYGNSVKRKGSKSSTSSGGKDVKLETYSYFFLGRCLLSNQAFVVFVSQRDVNVLFNTPSQQWQGQLVVVNDPKFTSYWLNVPVLKLSSMFIPVNKESMKIRIPTGLCKTTIATSETIERNNEEMGFHLFFADKVDINIIAPKLVFSCQNSGCNGIHGTYEACCAPGVKSSSQSKFALEGELLCPEHNIGEGAKFRLRNVVEYFMEKDTCQTGHLPEGISLVDIRPLISEMNRKYKELGCKWSLEGWYRTDAGDDAQRTTFYDGVLHITDLTLRYIDESKSDEENMTTFIVIRDQKVGRISNNLLTSARNVKMNIDVSSNVRLERLRGFQNVGNNSDERQSWQSSVKNSSVSDAKKNDGDGGPETFVQSSGTFAPSPVAESNRTVQFASTPIVESNRTARLDGSNRFAQRLSFCSSTSSPSCGISKETNLEKGNGNALQYGKSILSWTNLITRWQNRSGQSFYKNMDINDLQISSSWIRMIESWKNGKQQETGTPEPFVFQRSPSSDTPKNINQDYRNEPSSSRGTFPEFSSIVEEENGEDDHVPRARAAELPVSSGVVVGSMERSKSHHSSSVPPVRGVVTRSSSNLYRRHVNSSGSSESDSKSELWNSSQNQKRKNSHNSKNGNDSRSRTKSHSSRRMKQKRSYSSKSPSGSYRRYGRSSSRRSRSNSRYSRSNSRHSRSSSRHSEERKSNKEHSRSVQRTRKRRYGSRCSNSRHCRSNSRESRSNSRHSRFTSDEERKPNKRRSRSKSVRRTWKRSYGFKSTSNGKRQKSSRGNQARRNKSTSSSSSSFSSTSSSSSSSSRSSSTKEVKASVKRVLNFSRGETESSRTVGEEGETRNVSGNVDELEQVADQNQVEQNGTEVERNETEFEEHDQNETEVADQNQVEQNGTEVEHNETELEEHYQNETEVERITLQEDGASERNEMNVGGIEHKRGEELNEVEHDSNDIDLQRSVNIQKSVQELEQEIREGKRFITPSVLLSPLHNVNYNHSRMSPAHSVSSLNLREFRYRAASWKPSTPQDDGKSRRSVTSWKSTMSHEIRRKARRSVTPRKRKEVKRMDL